MITGVEEEKTTRVGTSLGRRRLRQISNFFFFFFLCCVHRRSGRDGRETRHSTVVRANNLLYFVAPNCPRASREPPRTRHRERERITEKVDFRRAKVCRQKSERVREREIERKREEKRVYGSIGCSATRGLVSGSVDDDLLLYRNLLVFCPTY